MTCIVFRCWCCFIVLFCCFAGVFFFHIRIIFEHFFSFMFFVFVFIFSYIIGASSVGPEIYRPTLLFPPHPRLAPHPAFPSVPISPQVSEACLFISLIHQMRPPPTRRPAVASCCRRPVISTCLRRRQAGPLFLCIGKRFGSGRERKAVGVSMSSVFPFLLSFPSLAVLLSSLPLTSCYLYSVSSLFSPLPLHNSVFVNIVC